VGRKPVEAPVSNVVSNVLRWQLARFVVEAGIVRVSTDFLFPHRNGGFAPIYFDFRLVQSIPWLRDLVTSMLEDIVRPLMPHGIAGVQTGIVPVSILVSDRLDIPHYGVRKDPKKGDLPWIDGEDPRGKSLVLLEDVITSGTSVRNALKRLRDCRANILACGCIFAYHVARVKDILPNTFALITLDDFEGPMKDAGMVDDVSWGKIIRWRDGQLAGA